MLYRLKLGVTSIVRFLNWVLRGKSMFKITYKELRSQSFINAMSKVANCTEYDHKTAYNIMRLSKTLEKNLTDSQKEWILLANGLIKKDEKGNFKLTEKGFEFLDDVSPEEAQKKIEEYLEKALIIERHKIDPEKIHVAKLSPADYAALSPILKELDP